MRSDRPRVLLGLLVALVGGFAVGTVGTFKYRFGLAGGAPLVPIGLAVALPAIALVLIALRVLLETRAYAIAAGVGVLVAVGLYTLPGPGGSVVVVDDGYGLAWLIGAVVVVAVVLGTPRIRRRRSPGARGDDGILVAPLPAGGEKERGPQ